MICSHITWCHLKIWVVWVSDHLGWLGTDANLSQQTEHEELFNCQLALTALSKEMYFSNTGYILTWVDSSFKTFKWGVWYRGVWVRDDMLEWSHPHPPTFAYTLTPVTNYPLSLSFCLSLQSVCLSVWLGTERITWSIGGHEKGGLGDRPTRSRLFCDGQEKACKTQSSYSLAEDQPVHFSSLRHVTIFKNETQCPFGGGKFSLSCATSQRVLKNPIFQHLRFKLKQWVHCKWLDN